MNREQTKIDETDKKFIVFRPVRLLQERQRKPFTSSEGMNLARREARRSAAPSSIQRPFVTKVVKVGDSRRGGEMFR